jgi:transcriptional regulator of acetoin/glycerol metabolism
MSMLASCFSSPAGEEHFVDNRDTLTEALDIIFDRIFQSDDFGIKEAKEALIATMIGQTSSAGKAARALGMGRSTIYRRAKDTMEDFQAAADDEPYNEIAALFPQALRTVCASMIEGDIKIDDVERKFVQFMLDASDKTNKSAATLGMGRSTLYRRLRDYRQEDLHRNDKI